MAFPGDSIGTVSPATEIKRLEDEIKRFRAEIGSLDLGPHRDGMAPRLAALERDLARCRKSYFAQKQGEIIPTKELPVKTPEKLCLVEVPDYVGSIVVDDEAAGMAVVPASKITVKPEERGWADYTSLERTRVVLVVGLGSLVFISIAVLAMLAQ